MVGLGSEHFLVIMAFYVGHLGMRRAQQQILDGETDYRRLGGGMEGLSRPLTELVVSSLSSA